LFTTVTHAPRMWIVKKKIYQTHWTPKQIKMFREENLLTQLHLAILLNTCQQRISEWEMGIHSVKRAYSTLLDQVREKVERIHRGSGSAFNYKSAMKQQCGIDL
jgi:DNA-binding transcriptional regulator YiaG